MVKIEINKNHYFEIINSKDINNMNINIPDIQRNINQDRINEIINNEEKYFKKYKTHNFCFSPIVICVCKETNNYLCIDGQHRMHCVYKFIEKKRNFDILFSIFTVKTKLEVDELFMNINKSLPIPIFSDEIDIHKICNDVYKYYTTKYDGYFKSTLKPQRPNISFEKFKMNISELIEKYNIKTKEDIFNIIEKINNVIKEKCNDPKFKKSFSESIYEKCCKGDFYLGLVSDWIDLHNNNNSIIIVENKKKRSKPPDYIRNIVWERDKGICRLCNRKLHDIRDCHMGHIISDKNGGSINENNLVVTCSSCNTSLGSKNIDQYFKEQNKEWKL
jgi:hypothetical protein